MAQKKIFLFFLVVTFFSFTSFVSRTYLPSKNWIQYDGNFGVMIGVIAAN